MAMHEALDAWRRGATRADDYDDLVSQARELFAQLVHANSARVAVGSHASVTAGVVAASLPDGARVVCVDGDFTSIIFPFVAQADRGITVRHVPLDGLADAIAEGDDLVAFSLAQSADGRVVDSIAVREAAARAGVMTLCDTTQAAGWLDTNAEDYDVTVCAAYKWLCAPRGVAFSTYSDAAMARLRPVNAGWYAGASVWDSCYGPQMTLAPDARRFDVSPAWLSWVGAVPALRLLATMSQEERAHGSRLADQLRERMGMPAQQRPVLALTDGDGSRARALERAGCVVASRASGVRIAFHLWNTVQDVDLAATALKVR